MVVVVGRLASASMNGRGGPNFERVLGIFAPTVDYSNSMVNMLPAGVNPADSMEAHLWCSWDSVCSTDLISDEGAHV